MDFEKALEKQLQKEYERNEKILKYWQGVLRLSDWKVTHEVVSQADEIDCHAQIHHDYTLKEAHIKIRADHIQLGGGESNPNQKLDQEWTLVHELLHILTWPLAPTLDHTAEEWLINCISKALVDLKRKAAS